MANVGNLIVTGTARVGNKVLAAGFNRIGSSDSYALLGGGGHKVIDSANTASAIVARDSSGYIRATYYNASCGAETPTTSSYLIYANSDGWFRKSSLANVKTILGLGSAAYTASTAYAAASHSHSYLPLYGGALTGNVSLQETSNILLRPSNASYTAGIGYDTSGNECIALWAKNTVTRLRWYAGADMSALAAGTMMGKTPDFEISKASGSALGYIGGFSIALSSVLYTGTSTTVSTSASSYSASGTGKVTFSKVCSDFDVLLVDYDLTYPSGTGSYTDQQVCPISSRNARHYHQESMDGSNYIVQVHLYPNSDTLEYSLYSQKYSSTTNTTGFKMYIKRVTGLRMK